MTAKNTDAIAELRRFAMVGDMAGDCPEPIREAIFDVLSRFSELCAALEEERKVSKVHLDAAHFAREASANIGTGDSLDLLPVAVKKLVEQAGLQSAQLAAKERECDKMKGLVESLLVYAEGLIALVRAAYDALSPQNEEDGDND